MFKRLTVMILSALLLINYPMLTRGDDGSSYPGQLSYGEFSRGELSHGELSHGELSGLFGNQSRGELQYPWGDRYQLEAYAESGVTNLGVGIQLFSWLNLKAGYTHDSGVTESFPYGGVNFDQSFGVSGLRIRGAYDYNYIGRDWARYEAALRIPVYDDVSLDAGFRGDAGAGAPQYSYNEAQETLLFLRGEIMGSRGNWEWHLEPLLYVNGTLLHDYSLKYRYNERTALVMNVNTLYENHDLQYRAGIAYKF